LRNILDKEEKQAEVKGERGKKERRKSP